VRRASSASDLLADPIGRYWAGRRHCVFAHSPTLLGFASWGRPDVDDVRELLRVCEIGLKPDMVPYRWLVDLRGLELVEPATFALFIEHTRAHGETLGSNILKQAQIRPDGFVGAVIAGFGLVARLSYPDRVFGDVEEALAWLEVDGDQGAALLAELEAIRREAREGYAIVTRLRHELDAAGALRIEDGGSRLGMSTRSLQRALREAGTTYRAELDAFRIRRAHELLRQDERSLSWIAHELGFSSAQHFATAFRRAMGETPSVWRMRHRASA
jgi:AraC-like DNA-binding protein